MAVVASATGAAVFGLSGVAAGVAGGALLGAGAGALYSGITGDGDILNSALTGGLIGGAVGGLGAAFAPAAAGGGAGLTGASGAGGALGSGSALQLAPTAATSAYGSLGASSVPSVAGTASLSAPGVTSAGGYTGLTAAKLPSLASTSLSNLSPAASSMTGNEMLGYGLAGTAAMSLMGGMNQKKLSSTTGTSPSYIRPYTYSSIQNNGQNGTTSAYPTTPTYGANGLPNLDTRERNYFTQSYTAGTPYQAANGGLMSIGGTVERMSQNAMGGTNNMYPQSQVQSPAFATPTQMPVSAEVVNSGYVPQPYTGMANGGITYDAATQTYQGLPSSNALPAVEIPQLSDDLVAQLTPQYQAANPNAFSYDPVKQRYGAVNPSMSQLNAFKSEQDRIAAEELARTQQMDQGYQSYKKGGKADDEFNFDDLTKSQKKYYLDLMATQLAAQKIPGSDVGSQNSFEKYMMSQTPAGVYGRAGVTKAMDDGSSLRAGLSGIAMAQPGKQGITAMPNSYDVGYNTPVGSGNVDLSAYRSVDTMPGRGHAQGVNARYTLPFAAGGGVDSEYNLGSYSDGGRLLKGPGDGVSDDIPAMIGDSQPARLADGEFVIPARIVSEIGNGSTDAGAKRLYAMMDKIQAGRKKTIGKNNVAKDTKAKKHLLA